MQRLPVTVVIPAYNRAELIPRALRSVAAQRPYQPCQVIVVDDASEDDTAGVAQSLGARVIRLDVNSGPATARNTGFWATTTPWLIQLDSDDEWLPHCLRTLWELRHGHVLVSGGSIGERRDGTPWYNGIHGRETRLLRSPAKLVFPDNVVASSAALLDTEAVRAVGGYRSDLRYAEDLELWLRLLERGTGVVTPVVVTRYHGHAGQLTAVEGEAHRGHAFVLALSADRPWWCPRLGRRWSAVPRWDALRHHLAAGNNLDAARVAIKLVLSPQRLIGLAAVLLHRLRGRRRSSRLTLEAQPTLAALPGAGWIPAAVDVDLRGRTLARALLHLLRQPTAEAACGSYWQQVAVRALGIKPASSTAGPESEPPGGGASRARAHPFGLGG